MFACADDDSDEEDSANGGTLGNQGLGALSNNRPGGSYREEGGADSNEESSTINHAQRVGGVQTTPSVPAATQHA